MMETVGLITDIGGLFVFIALLVLVVMRWNLPGRVWLLAFLASGIFAFFVWGLSSFLQILGVFIEGAWFWDGVEPLAYFVQFAGFCALIPFILMMTGTVMAESAVPDVGHSLNSTGTGDTSDPFYGVRGWLKFFVIVNIYVAPVLFVLIQIVGFIAISMIAGRYPGMVLVGLIEAAVGAFFMVKWIMIARRLRDIVPGVVQEAKTWLKIALAWNLLSIPLVFLSGMRADDLAFGVVRTVVVSVISFAIWYSYFNVSKRVKATYPDWNA